MTTIIVSGLPTAWDMKMLVRKLIRAIKGKYVGLAIKRTNSSRNGYIRLSEGLDPMTVVQSINSTKFGTVKLHARIPDVEPKLPSRKPTRIPLSLRRAYNIPNESSLGQVLHTAHSEILEELQSKYAGLFKLSKTTGHKLMAAISQKVRDYLQRILTVGHDVDSSFKLTKAYRRRNPHHGDFGFIQSTLNDLERSAGRPVTTLSKINLMTPTENIYAISDIPLNKVQVICEKYSKRISGKLQNHIKHLNTDANEQPMEEELAVQKVRLELKKIVPYIPMMIQKVVKDNILQNKCMYYKVRIYGEPYLPNKETMAKFLKQYHSIKVYRSDRMFNLIFCKVPLTTLPKLIESDKTNICGATMYIRISNVDYYRVPGKVVSELLSFNPVTPTPAPPATTCQTDANMEWNETW